MKGIEFPKEPVVVVPEEVTKRREWLLARQAQREYQSKIQNLKLNNAPKKDANEVKGVLKEISVAFALILICGGVFFAVFISSKQIGYSNGVCLSLGLVAMIFMLVVEMLLFIIRSTRIESRDRYYNKLVDGNPSNISGLVLPQKLEVKKEE